MRIVIDGRMLGWTGVGRYTKKLLGELQQIDRLNHYQVLLLKKDWNKWQPVADNFEKVEADFRPYGFGEQIGLAILLYRLRPNLVHFLASNRPILYFGRQITTVHDLTLIDHRNIRENRFGYSLKRLAFLVTVLAAVWLSKRIITPTEYVKGRLIKRYHLDPGKIHTTYEAADELAAAPEAIEAIKPPFILHVGNFYAYKNLERLIQAFGQIKTKHPGLKLVLAGRMDFWGDRLKEKVADPDVIFPGYVSDGQLVYLYQYAELFVMPSLSEGFGLPGLEAMLAGTPVVAAKASCLPEVYARGAVFFDPTSSADMAEKISTLITNPDMKNRLREAGKRRAEEFSWGRMAQQTLEIYSRLAS